MKFHAVFALIVASICTLSGTEANIITDQIISALEDVCQALRDAGMDPLHIKREAGYYSLPVPAIFNAAGFCEDVISTGLSDIIVNDIHYDLLAFRLTFDVEMPHIHFSVGTVAGAAVVFDNNLNAEGAGSIDIYNARVRGDLRIGILGGVSVRSADIDSSIRNIDSNIQLNLLGNDVSDALNNFIGNTILAKLEAFKSEVDELISIYLIQIINENILN